MVRVASQAVFVCEERKAPISALTSCLVSGPNLAGSVLRRAEVEPGKQICVLQNS